MSNLKIISYNIHKGKTASGFRGSIPLLCDSLKELDPDLIFLQEVQGINSRVETLNDQHNRIAQHLGLSVAYGCNAVRKNTSHGNALLSRLPIVGQENQDVSDHRLEQRGLLHVRVALGERLVHCFVVHLGLFHRSRERQVAAIVSRIQSMVGPDEPLIIAGDFNDWNNNLEPLFVEALNLTEAFSKQPRTYPVMMPLLRLDRMYHRGFELISAQVLKGRPWRQISDHAPLFAELAIVD